MDEKGGEIMEEKGGEMKGKSRILKENSRIQRDNYDDFSGVFDNKVSEDSESCKSHTGKRNEMDSQISQGFNKRNDRNNGSKRVREIKSAEKSDGCWLAVETEIGEKKKKKRGNTEVLEENSKRSRRKYKKVFFFIVDALRLDFMVVKKNSGDSDSDSSGDKATTSSPPLSSPSSSSSSSSPPSSYNRFSKMHTLLRENATQTGLFGFRADPPTVTSQRLKGATVVQSTFIN